MMDFHLLRPYFLLLILIQIGLFYWLRHVTGQPTAWLKICDPELLCAQTVNLTGKSAQRLLTFFFLAWLVACFILAGPTWKRMPESMYQRFSPSIIILDLSEEMLKTDILPNRLARAKFKIHDILKQSDSAQVGLVVFAHVPYAVSPLTKDAETLISMIPELHPNIIPVPGRRLHLALEKAGELFKQAGVNRGSVLVISGGHIDKAALVQAKSLASAGINTSVLNMGEQALNAIAQVGGGGAIKFTDDNQDVQTWIKQLRRYQSDSDQQQQLSHQWKDQGRVLLWFLLPMILLLFRRGWLEVDQ